MTREALRLLREGRAREVFDGGRFVGIELYSRPEVIHEPLPPAELPGLHFDDPNAQRRYARFHWEFS